MENYIVSAPNEQEKYNKLIKLEKLGKLRKDIMPINYNSCFQTFLTNKFNSSIWIQTSKSITHFYNSSNILEYSTIREKGISHPYFSLTVQYHL